MPLVDTLLPEFDHEMTLTRKVLERVPDGRFDWKPHAKSMALGHLATHVANLANWGEVTLSRSEFDLAAGPPDQLMATRADLVALFDKNVAASRAALTGKSDAELMAPWTLRRDT